ncbi:MAG: AsmA family protein [Methylobacteriaceae bacterium]|nr:AsmA family protein [Methylobacteriaceae bacterium]
MRDILTILAGIVIVLLTVALGVPYFIDWSAHRAEIEARLTQALGVPIAIAGPIDIKLLPTPTLRIQRFSAGGEDLGLSGTAARFELALVPLFRGDFQILEADLDAPRLSASVDAQGALTLPNLSAKTEKVQLERLIIRDGTLVLNDGGPQPTSIASGLSFTGSADSLSGPVKGQGEFKRDGRLIAYRFSTGAIDSERLRLKLVLDASGEVSRADFDGALLGKRLDGRWQIGFEGTATLSGWIGDAGPPWRVAAAGNADAQGLRASTLDVRLGDEDIALSATGEADVRFGDGGSAHIDLSSRQLDLDRFRSKFDLAALLRVANDGKAQPLLPVSIDWHADTITLGGDTMSDVFAGARLDPARPLTLAAAATLPARSRFSANGSLERGIAPGFNGKIEFATRDPERFAGWLSPLLPDVAQNLKALPFKTIEIAGQAGLSAAGFFVRDLQARLDRSSFAGTVSYTRALGSERARLFADLTSAALDIEKLPDMTGAAQGAADLDLSVSLDAKAVKLGGVAATPIDAGRIRAKLTRDATETRLERLAIADLGGANIEASGRWRDGTAQLEGRLDAAQLGDLANLVARLAPGHAAALLQSRASALSPAHLNVRGESDRLRPALFGFNVLSVDGSLGATRTTMRLAQAADDLQTSEATLVLDSPEAAALARQLGTTVLPLRGLGKGRLTATMRGQPGAQWRGRLSGSFAGTTTDFDGTLGIDGVLSGDAQRPLLSGNLKVSSGDAIPLLQLMALTLPDMTARLTLDLAGRLDWSPAAWRVDGLAGTINGGAIAGELSHPANAAAIQGNLVVDKLPIQTLARTVLGPEQPLRAGATWSATAFGQPLADPPRMELNLKSARIDLSDTLSASDASLHLALAPAGLAIDHLSMHLASGRIDGNLALRREDANVALSGHLAFDQVAVDKPAFSAAMTGSLEFASSGKSEATLAAGLAGMGELALTNVRVNNSDPAAVASIVALAEDEKISIEPKEVDTALSRELDRGPLQGNRELSYNVAIASGVLRLSPRSAYSSGSTLTTLQPTFDTRTFGMNVQADIASTALPRGWTGPAPQISVAWTKLLTQPTRRIDSSALITALAARAAQREAERIQSLEFDIKERAFFNRRLKWDRARQEERDREAAERARAEQERIDQERRAEQERIERERRATAEAEAARRRAATEAAQRRAAAAEAEAARRRAEGVPVAPAGADNPFLRPAPPTAPGTTAPYFRAPGAGQDPSAAGRY